MSATEPTARNVTLCPTGCGRGVRRGHLTCGPCWAEVPKHLQLDVYRTWRKYDKEPTDVSWFEYVEAREAALLAVP